MKKFLGILKIIFAMYFILCSLLFLFQEKLIFFPQKLDKNFKFNFDQDFEEITVITEDQKTIHGLLFRCDSAKGLIFYLHGNAGSLHSWGEVAKSYTDLKYDVFMPDYRGYGKSEGTISSQEQIFNDLQIAYDQMKKRYREDKIILLGYSIGTGPAAKIASSNNPGLLILQAPYYSLTDMMRHTYPVIPAFLLKYKFETYRYIEKCKMPVLIFHGNQDEVIYYGSSLKLKEHFKEQDTLITLTGQRHNGMTFNSDYLSEIKRVLNRPLLLIVPKQARSSASRVFISRLPAIIIPNCVMKN